MPVTIRPLERSDWETFRDLRLFALASEPGVFASTHAREAEFVADDWQHRIAGPDCRAFGAFDGDRLVGITGTYAPRDDPSGETAALVMSYLLPEYRGRGISALFYEARLNWLREHGKFKRVIVSHRRSNDASRRANQRFGFALIQTASATWPDGGVEDELMYELRLEADAGVSLVELRDDDFAALLRGDRMLRDGLRVPPGGVDVTGVLEHVRAILAKLRRRGHRGGHWMVVAGGEIVGLIGFKDPPSALGEVEIGYGIAASRRRRGFATRAVAAVLEEAGRDPAIRTVVAETAAGNTASQRALIRNGFALAGTRQDRADGELFLWRRSLADPGGT